MIIRITNRCNQRCRHCAMEQVGPEGAHMELELFEACLDFARRIDSPVLILSGGEPTMHPGVLAFIKRAGLTFTVVLASNGYFLEDEELAQELKAISNPLPYLIQVTYDPRYYTHPLPQAGLSYLPEKVHSIFPCARTREAGIKSTIKYPACFNLRSLTRFGGLRFAQRHFNTLGRFCVPSVDVDGTIHAGEFDGCHAVGHVTDPLEKVEQAIQNMCCDNCGLTKNLLPDQRRALGLLG